MGEVAGNIALGTLRTRDPAGLNRAGLNPLDFRAPTPVGLLPRHLWLEARLEDVRRALAIYGSSGQPLPPEWTWEYNFLSDELDRGTARAPWGTPNGRPVFDPGTLEQRSPTHEPLPAQLEP